ncbi:VWA domain-containing protein [Frankia sp. Ag45/Mut15]|uniref:VWA domain-containing protein n=1 Tax=Frankia umida TaxID=573489 RepID=A0ABT0JVF0_9ACTN|nr:VWA domain-containing protein [Frankia umida]MCK9875513.1 VWA domain-containing protein [Frankia umida]
MPPDQPTPTATAAPTPTPTTPDQGTTATASTPATAAGVAGGEDERLRRWRLVLGTPAASMVQGAHGLSQRDVEIDTALAALYDTDQDGNGSGTGSAGRGTRQRRSAGLGGSAPAVARWLGDIRDYFPSSVVQVLQRDAVTRLGITRMLLEPELLAAAEPDVHLVGTLLSLRSALPERTRQTAREVVRKVVEEIERRLEHSLRSAVLGALDRAQRTRTPRLADVDWNATILANLRNYQPDQRTVIVDRLIGHQRARRSAALRDVILLIDQSGSMASSVVHAGVLGASLASLRAVNTSLVVFDTSVVDLTDQLDDPVDVLFGVQLGGGTDIDRAVGYGASLVRRPSDTVLFLISDLIEGGDQSSLIARLRGLVDSGVTVIVLLALCDDGTPAYSHTLAATCAELGAPAFACTPDRFPELLATALRREDVGRWAALHGLTLV